MGNLKADFRLFHIGYLVKLPHQLSALVFLFSVMVLVVHLALLLSNGIRQIRSVKLLSLLSMEKSWFCLMSAPGYM